MRPTNFVKVYNSVKIVKKKIARFYQKITWFHQKPCGFLKNRPLCTGFCEFFIASFFILENCSVLFETCIFVTIL
jgi:hypothetical protein